nr:hypothetical protein [Amycolatopsis anabasis]
MTVTLLAQWAQGTVTRLHEARGAAMPAQGEVGAVGAGTGMCAAGHGSAVPSGGSRPRERIHTGQFDRTARENVLGDPETMERDAEIAEAADDTYHGRGLTGAASAQTSHPDKRLSREIDTRASVLKGMIEVLVGFPALQDRQPWDERELLTQVDQVLDSIGLVFCHRKTGCGSCLRFTGNVLWSAEHWRCPYIVQDASDS